MPASWSERARSLRAALAGAAGESGRGKAIADLTAFFGEAREAFSEAGDEASRDLLVAVYLAGQGIVEDMGPGERPAGVALGEVFAALEAAARRLGGPELLAKVLVQRAAWARGEGRLDAARADLERAAGLDGAPKVRPQALLGLSDLARQMGRFEEAEALLARAEAALDPALPFHRVVRCEILGVRGQLALHQGRPETAARFLSRALESARGLGDPALLAGARLRRANLALAVEDPETVLALLAEAEADGVVPAVLRLRGALAEAELERDDAERPRRARGLLEAVLGLPGLPASDRVDAHLALAEVLLREGDAEAAGAHLEAAEKTLESLDPDPLGRAARQRRRLATLRARLALFDGDRAEMEAARRDLDEAFARFLAEWRGRSPRPDGRGLLHFGDTRALLSERIRLDLALDGERGAARALRGVLEASELGSLAHALGARGHDLAAARSLLHEGEVFLFYLPAPDRSHLFLLSGSGLWTYEIAPDVAIFRARRAFDGALLAGAGAAKGAVRGEAALARWREAGRRLRDLILPSAALARVRAFPRWTVVGIDILGSTPFEALPLGETGIVGIAHAVAYLPSVAVGLALSARPARRSRESPFVVFAPPLGEGTEPFDEPRAAALLGRRLAASSRLVVGEAATRGALPRAARSASFGLLVRAHGVRDPDRDRPVGLNLADGVLFAEEAERSDAPPFVTLAACGAARGPLRRGEDGVADLGGTFLAAGARVVLVPSAEVDLGATEALLAAAFREFENGTDPAEALRRARAELWRDERFRDPRFVALVHAVGLAQEPMPWPTPGRKPLWLWIFAALGLSLAVRSLVKVPPRRARGVH